MMRLYTVSTACWTKTRAISGKRFAGLRALYGYTMAHPGKKLLFMGGEFAHFIEWKYDDQLDWFLLVYERHAPLQSCVKKLNHLYRDIPALHEVDNSWNGFQWINANDSDNSIISFLRTDKSGNAILCVTNFTPVFHPIYRIACPAAARLRSFSIPTGRNLAAAISIMPMS